MHTYTKNNINNNSLCLCIYEFVCMPAALSAFLCILMFAEDL